MAYNFSANNETIISVTEGVKFFLPEKYSNRIEILAKWQDNSVAAFSYSLPKKGKVFFIGFLFTDFIPYKGTAGAEIIEDLFHRIGLKRNIVPSEFGIQAVLFEPKSGNGSNKILIYNGNNYPVNSKFAIQYGKNKNFSVKAEPASLFVMDNF